MYGLEFAGEDDRFAAAEARTAAGDLDVVGPGLATAGTLAVERVSGLAYTRYATELVGRTDADVEAARARLAEAGIDRTGSVAVRARNVRGSAGVDTSAAERALGNVLVERGLAIDLEAPDHELRAAFAQGTCLLGWRVAASDRGFGARAPTEKPFFHPGSMEPLEARAVANLAGAGPGRTLLDPMCGTGGILVEAGLVGARVLGADAQRAMVAGARRNLAQYLGSGGTAVLRADARRLPLAAGCVDGVVVDPPYGKQSAIVGADADTLVHGALTEADRVVADGRAVVVADRPIGTLLAGTGWALTARYDRPVHRSLTRHVHVLEPASNGDGRP